MSNNLEDELRSLHKKINELTSRQARTILDGKVKEVDGNKVRLEIIEEDPHTGKPFLTPWVRVQEEAGDGLGGYSSYTQRQVGQNMKLLSPSGEIGKNSIAIDSGHNDENPTPGAGKAKVMKHGDASIVIVEGKITLAVGDMSIVITSDEIVTYGKTRLNNGSFAIHRIGDKDSSGDRAVGGASGAFA